MLMRPVWVEYSEFLSEAKGGLTKESEALVNLYLQASLGDYAERHQVRAGLTEQHMWRAQNLVESSVGNIEDYFKSAG